jgi:hypothetical protein
MKIIGRIIWCVVVVILVGAVVFWGVETVQINKRVTYLENQLILSKSMAPGENISTMIVYLDQKLHDVEQEQEGLITDTANLKLFFKDWSYDEPQTVTVMEALAGIENQINNIRETLYK